MRCPVCNQSELEPFFDGGEVPLFVNVLHGDPGSAKSAARGRIELGGCQSCGFVRNIAFDESLLAYAPGYENSLHGSPTFQDWARDLSAGLVERHGLSGGRAVEIGGGRGEFMELLLEAGCAAGLVTDPSAPDDALEDRADLTLERRLFDAADVTDTTPPTKLILSRHVLEHIAEPMQFASMVADAARTAGAGVYLEVPNGLWTLRDLGIWDLIYEHCSYFTPSALTALLERAGLTVEVAETFGGQFLSAEGRPGAAGASASEPAEAATARAAFGQAHRDAVESWNERLDRWRAEGRRAAIWGAGSKGATFLNTVPSEGSIVCAVDVNERKWNRFVAGTGHPIVGPGALSATRVDTVIVMNPRYLEEISGMVQEAGVEAEVLPIAG